MNILLRIFQTILLILFLLISYHVFEYFFPKQKTGFYKSEGFAGRALTIIDFLNPDYYYCFNTVKNARMTSFCICHHITIDTYSQKFNRRYTVSSFGLECKNIPDGWRIMGAYGGAYK